MIFGEQWLPASHFIGLWGLTSAITVVLSHYSSEVYRSKGKPRISVLSQFLHLIVLCPAILIAVKYGFEALYTTRAFVRLEGVLVNLLLMHFIFHISAWKMFYNIRYPVLGSVLMVGTSCFLNSFCQSMFWQCLSAFICIAIYFAFLFIIPSERKIYFSLLHKIK